MPFKKSHVIILVCAGCGVLFGLLQLTTQTVQVSTSRSRASLPSTSYQTWSMGAAIGEDAPFETPSIVDEARILGAFSHHLDRMIKGWGDDLGIEIKIISLDGRSEDINVLAHNKFESMRVGQSYSNGGMLFLIDNKAGLVRIEVSSKLEGVFTDAHLSIVAKKQLAPYASAQIVGMALMDVLRYLKDYAIQQAIYGNLTVSDQFKRTAEYQETQKMLSIGGGVKTSISPETLLKHDYKAKLPKDALEQYAPSEDPRTTVDHYILALKNMVGDPELPLYTAGSKVMARAYPYAPYEVQAELHLLERAQPLRIDQQGDYAIAYSTNKDSGVRPIMLKKVGRVWLVDKVEAIKNLFFMDGGKFTLMNSDTPYYPWLSVMYNDASNELLAPFPIPEDELDAKIEELKNKKDPLSKFILAEILFCNAFSALEALQYYEEAVTLAPTDPLFTRVFSERALYLGFPELVIPHLKKLDFSDVYLLFRAYAGANKYERNVKLAQELLKRNPNSLQAHILMKQSFEKLGRQDEAEKEWKNILDLKADPEKASQPVYLEFDPDHPTFHARGTVQVGTQSVYGYQKFYTTMKNYSNRPVKIDSVNFVTLGTGHTSGLGDIKSYWAYPSNDFTLRAGEAIGFDKVWGYTIDPNHLRCSNLFLICWHELGIGSKQQCSAQRLDMPTTLDPLGAIKINQQQLH